MPDQPRGCVGTDFTGNDSSLESEECEGRRLGPRAASVRWPTTICVAGIEEGGLDFFSICHVSPAANFRREGLWHQFAIATASQIENQEDPGADPDCGLKNYVSHFRLPLLAINH